LFGGFHKDWKGILRGIELNMQRRVERKLERKEWKGNA
jgi:hypothetical protein